MGLFPHFCGKQQPGTVPTSKQKEEGLSWCTTGFSTASRIRKPSLRALWGASFWAQLTLQQELETQMTFSGVGLKPGLRTFEERDCAGTMPFQHWDFKPAHQRPALRVDTEGLSSLRLCRECLSPLLVAREAASPFFPHPHILCLHRTQQATTTHFFLAVNTAPSQSSEIRIFFF